MAGVLGGGRAPPIAFACCTALAMLAALGHARCAELCSTWASKRSLFSTRIDCVQRCAGVLRGLPSGAAHAQPVTSCPAHAVQVFSEVCQAVQHMHSQSPPLAHRDLKAENVLKNCAGRWVLCDFGSTTHRAQVRTKLVRMATSQWLTPLGRQDGDDQAFQL
eukprot:1158826-Pelagomonas_calceolata.AAC.6